MTCWSNAVKFPNASSRGGVGIFGFADLANFWCLARFAVFFQFCLWFSVFVNNDGGFSDCFVQCILRFFWPNGMFVEATSSSERERETL